MTGPAQTLLSAPDAPPEPFVYVNPNWLAVVCSHLPDSRAAATLLPLATAALADPTGPTLVAIPPDQAAALAVLVLVAPSVQAKSYQPG